MEAALGHVAEGHAQLLTFHDAAGKHRGLILRVLGALVAVVLLVAAFR